MAGPESWTFCERILPAVSRSFALIIPRCPAPLDRALCVAYLICRLADTVEDDPSLSAIQRDELYEALLAAVDEPLDLARSAAFVALWPSPPEGAYGALVLGTGHVLTALAALPARLLLPIRACVGDMIEGMRRTVHLETRQGVRFMCRDLDELDRYCHYVAGTVGIMSTALFETRFRPRGVELSIWREQGRRLGLGLQMTNIIKDCRVDARRGVSFVPSSCVTFAQGGYELTREGRAVLIAHTVGHLDAALLYVLSVPEEETGIRTFLLGSMLPAIATLEVAAGSDQFQPKITRPVMTEILDLVAEHTADGPALRDWYERRRASALAGAGALPPAVGERDNLL